MALTTLLKQIELLADDKIVFLGDYIDRGPGSREVVETLLGVSNKCAPTFLRGNHEAMLLAAREDTLKANVWQSYGGFEALISYGAEYNQNWATVVPDSHWDFFERTARYFETEDHIFVHACLDPEADLDEQPDWLLYWESVDRLKAHKSGKRILCDHAPQRSGQILDLGFALCIDTGAVDGGWLTCLDVRSGAWWQSKEKGETRMGLLDAVEIGGVRRVTLPLSTACKAGASLFSHGPIKNWHAALVLPQANGVLETLLRKLVLGVL